jgi:hypothetical protein
MGQTSLKYLNRAGYSLHWDKSWESRNVYGHTSIKIFFIDFFLTSFFKNNFLQKSSLFNKKLTETKTTHSYTFFNFISFFNEPLKFFSYSNFFQSKIWIFNYQNWIIINVYIYFPKLLKRRRIINTKNSFLASTQRNFSRIHNNYNFI